MKFDLTTNNFPTYLRTKMFWRNRLRNVDISEPVFVPKNELKKVDVATLANIGEVAVLQKPTTKGFMANFYKALKPGPVNLSMVVAPKGKGLDKLTLKMREHLKLVSLKSSEASTIYFDVFLTYVTKYPDLFFTVDLFSGRVHTPISSFHREYRKGILIEGEPTASLDVTTMQPLLLGKILEYKIGQNEYSDWIKAGKDIYESIKLNTKLKSRDEAKKRFFEILFSYADNRLARIFGNANWIEWINAYKSIPIKANPHTFEKQHSNLAWLLQSTEVKIMREVWQELANNCIVFLSVHDEVIIKEIDLPEAKLLFCNIMKKHFEFFKLNSKATNPNEFWIEYNSKLNNKNIS